MNIILKWLFIGFMAGSLLHFTTKLTKHYKAIENFMKNPILPPVILGGAWTLYLDVAVFIIAFFMLRSS